MSITFHLPSLQVHEDDNYRLEITLKNDGVIPWNSIQRLIVEVWGVDQRPTPNKCTLRWWPTDDSHRLVFQQQFFKDLELYENYKFVLMIKFNTGYMMIRESDPVQIVPWLSY
ncbi:hypothetical protein GGR58DRAFT_498188 [Xylaria digitata]|nr:hypothetical protein GGR58DRAFT_498188 [Xylaria digitata]